MAAWRWFLTPNAIQEYMRMTGRSGEMEHGNPDFDAAIAELGELSHTANLSAEGTDSDKRGLLVYRGKVTAYGRRKRVECFVSLSRREEGKLPQLTWVRFK
jgi:hypothetical protein